MQVGAKEIFSIEWNINEFVDRWIFGSFFFWINGHIVGNSNDSSVDLRSVVHWARTFLNEPKNRFEEDLFDLPSEQVFIRLASSVLANEDPENFVQEFYDETYSRFHISHIGMSSFDSVTLLLLKDSNGGERCVWKSGEENILDAVLPVNEIERVLAEFILEFDSHQ